VKVAPRGIVPDPGRAIGYCTTVKYLVGKTPEEMEDAVGLARQSKLAGGADIFRVIPLPKANEFQFRGYSQCPGGVPTDAPGYVAHPVYPPGRGVPQWELDNLRQDALKLIASVAPGERFRFRFTDLKPLKLLDAGRR